MKSPGILLCLTLPLAALDQRFSERVKLSGDMTASVYISGDTNEPKMAQVVFLRPGDAPRLKTAETALKLLDAKGKEISCHLSDRGEYLPAGHGHKDTTDALACYFVDIDDVKKIVSATITQGHDQTQALPLFADDPRPNLDGIRYAPGVQIGTTTAFVSVQPGKDGGVIAEVSIPAGSSAKPESIATADVGLTLIDSKGNQLKPQSLEKGNTLGAISNAGFATASAMFKLDDLTPGEVVEAWPSYRGEVVKVKFKPLSKPAGEAH